MEVLHISNNFRMHEPNLTQLNFILFFADGGDDGLSFNFQAGFLTDRT